MTALLTDPGALAALCAEISAAPWVGLDTEFVRERTYYAKLCLIQIATPRTLVLIDPLGLDIGPLGQALATTGPKILHAGRQDLELLLQETRRLPSPLFDTQIAAALAGHDDQIGYAALVAAVLKIELAKDVTRTNWAARPLSERQLAYAQDDVRHLEPLHAELGAALARLGRAEWLREDCAVLADLALYRFGPEQFTRRYRQGAGLAPRAQAIFQELLSWREGIARETDLPRSWVVSDAALLELALRAPSTVAGFQKLREWDERHTERYAAGALAAIADAPPAPLYPWPAPRLRPEEDVFYQALVGLVDTCARDLGIPAGVLGSRRALKEIVQGASPGSLARGWRAGVLGSEGARLFAEIAAFHDQSR